MKRSDTFWDSVADKYARKRIGNEAAYAQTLNRTRAYLSTDQKVLEIGCGTGTTALKLAPNVAQLTGTDISGRMIEIARDKVRDEAITNVSFAKQTIEDIAATADRYDVVLGFNILHLLDEPEDAIATLHSIIQPGGMLISKTPCLGQKLGYLKPLIWVLQKLGKAPRVHFLNYDRLENMIRAAGFEILETGEYPASTGSRFIVAKRV
ncbi:class I SAM-dependent methyltransferase [Thalassospira sp.]|uniref:class I SAM-dependent methyltransferase n=1 Tax=Thalassospira sp. TaxID=1912094 RepID=UPI000C5D95EA|nr:class I SAM-dependent methyltransferase [Thalassospira sp.]MBC08501.1 methyltransferase type 12 [Thalassospira sp.]|tara:strand:+ start:937 stop:1560 length:624 start_codon:yes stop_codon:yes gene_type:complete